MLLNVFDLKTAHGQSTVELQAGDGPGLGLTTDLLVVSAFDSGGDRATKSGSMGGLMPPYCVKLMHSVTSFASHVQNARNAAMTWPGESSRAMASASTRHCTDRGSLER